VRYTTFNDFEIKQTLKSNGFWHDKTPIVMVKNNNPMTTTTGLRSFNIQTDSHHGRYFLLGSVSTIIAGVVWYHFLK